MRLTTVALALLLLPALLDSGAGLAGEPRGAERMELFGGSRGAVPFPHALHQERLPDCMVCHDLFDQAPGSIQTLVQDGALRAKQVMNTQCVKCHRAERRAGRSTGPITCSKCHVK